MVRTAKPDLSGVDLSSVRAKLRRADQHLKTLRREIRTFVKARGHRFVAEPNADRTQYILHAYFARPPDVEQWGLVLGDAVHCLRSALDHLVYAIAICESNADPPPNHTRVMLPLTRTPESFTGAGRRISGLSKDVRARIESLQPYPGRDNDLLSLLEDLDVADKHRVLTFAVVQSVDADVPLRGLPPGEEVTLDAHVAPLKNGAPLLTITFKRPAPGVKVEGHVAVAVLLRQRFDVLSLADALRVETVRAISVLLGKPAVPTPAPVSIEGLSLSVESL